MKKTVLKGILQTLILMIALFLLIVQGMQFIVMASNAAMIKEDGFSEEDLEQLLFQDALEADEAIINQAEKADETAVSQAETGETAGTAAADDANPYSLATVRDKIINILNTDPKLCGLIYASMFLMIMLTLLLDHLPWRENSKKTKIMVLIDAALYLGCGVPFLVSGYTFDAVSSMTFLYSASIIGESIIRLKEKHTAGRIVFRVILILLTLANLITLRVFPLFVLAIIVLRAFKHILSISFSQIRLDILRKILRKTYAYEILLGLLLLMIAFSLLLCMLDGSMPDFLDALWFCFATVTTIGYGDIAATSVIGRILSVILGIYGIVVVALVTSIIVNFYNETKNDTKTEREEKGEEVQADEPEKES